MKAIGTSLLFVFAAACTAEPAPQQQTTPASVTYVTNTGTPPQAQPRKNQPPTVKLKLGHFTDGTIGVVIDRTEETENVADIDPIKVRFDGETKIWKLQGQHGAYGRIDYMRDPKHVMVHMFEDNQFSIYVPDPDGGKSSDEIQLYRDADADPL